MMYKGYGHAKSYQKEYDVRMPTGHKKGRTSEWWPIGANMSPKIQKHVA